MTRATEQASIEEGSLFPGCVPDTDALECPEDAYRALMRTKRAENGLDQSISRRKVISPEIDGAREAQLGRAQVTVDLGLPQRTDLGTFLENDRKVLSFECTWEDKALCVARRPVVWRRLHANTTATRSEFTQIRQRNHPLHCEMDTSRISEARRAGTATFLDIDCTTSSPKTPLKL